VRGVSSRRRAPAPRSDPPERRTVWRAAAAGLYSAPAPSANDDHEVTAVNNWLLVFHLLGIIFWMGGLLILSRMLGYHAREELAVQSRLSHVEKRLYWGAVVPGLVIVLVTGIWMLVENMTLMKNPGFHIKLTLVVVGIGVQFVVQKFIAGLRDEPKKSRGGKYKAVHGVLGLVLIGVLVSIYVVKRDYELRALGPQQEALQQLEQGK
jgi:putative membrane protein